MTRTIILLLGIFNFWTGIRAASGLPDSLRAQLQGQPDTLRIKTLIDRSGVQMYRNPVLARQYADWAMALAEETGLAKWSAKSLNQRGNTRWAAGDYGGALQDYKEVRIIFEELGDSAGMAKADNNLGLVYLDLSDYDRALDRLMASLRYFERSSESARTGTIYINVGNVHNRMGHDTLAENYYREAVDRFSVVGDTNGLCMAYNNLGLIIKQQNRGTEALTHFETALSGYEALGNLYGQAKVLSNIGTIYIEQERIREAEEVSRRSMELSQQLNNPYEIAISQLKMGEFYYKTGRFPEAIEMGKACLNSAEPTGALLPQSSAHELLALSYEKTGDPATALFHFKSFKQLNDSIFNENRAHAISELQVRYETDLKDEEIARINQQKVLDQWRKTALFGVIMALLLIGGLVVWTLSRRVRREKALKEKDRAMHATQKALAEAEIRTAELERLRLQEEVNYKSREITNLAMDIVRRNDLLELLDQELKALRKGADEKKLKDLSLLVSQNLSLESERQEFQLYVQEAQQNFFHQLEAQFPDLSQKERRLCAMIRLGLSSKEISAVFNIAVNSVEVARYRVRKKLNLDAGQGLKEFLDEL